MAKIHISNLEVHYGTLKGQPILRIGQFDVESGEIVAVCGRNHYGKSTLLKVLAGAMRDMKVTETSLVTFNDLGLADFGSSEISYLPQAFAATLFPWMSVGQNLRIRLTARHATDELVAAAISALCRAFEYEAESELYEALGFSLDGGTKWPGQLSGGQQQRLALLRAVVPAPRVLLLDEPFSAIDAFEGARFRNKLWAFIEGRGITTVFVTHDLHAAVHLADRVVVLKRQAETSTILANYSVGIRRKGPNLDPAEADELAAKIQKDCDV